ncbi:MAG: hypothetical protein H6R35_770 [Bacteroidetes bacterium]|nr:hypothetical protein [Bacteroidota bacterium]
MIKNKLLAGILFTVISITAAGQDIAFPDLEGFKRLTKYPVYLPENLWDFINGAADGFLALGFQDLHVAEYKKGKNVIKLEIYRHKDHIMAFGIYASERSSSFSFTNLGAQGYSIDGATNFFKGNYYVKIRTYSAKPKILQAAVSLAQRVANMLPGETVMPALLARFPSEGKKLNEETYINDNVLGHQFLNSAFQARYGIGNDVFSVYLIQKTSAAEILEMTKAYLSGAGIDSFMTDENRFVFTDGYNGTIFLSWKDNMMVIISGLAKDQADIAYKYTMEILK